MSAAPPTLTAVMPVLDGREHLSRSLPALFEAGRGLLAEVIVVDDGSSDGSADFAAQQGARVLSSGGRARGPACARNVGVRAARSEAVLFVDADVALHPDAVQRMCAALAEENTTAVFGSYDERPAWKSIPSQYANLRHHHGHQRPSDDAATFWSGLGAVMREPFLAIGGFDEGRYPKPSIEDIELGHRLRAAGGRIRRLPAIQGTHLKRWRWRDVVHTDVVCRALPWSRLMLEHPGAFDDLNVGLGERLKMLVAGALVVTGALAALGSVPAWVPLLFLALAFVANWSLARLFLRRGGAAFAFVATLFHQVYFLYSGAAYGWCLVGHLLRPRALESRKTD